MFFLYIFPVIAILMSVYLSWHIRTSFFPEVSLKVSIPTILVSLIAIATSFIWTNYLLYILPYPIFRTIQLITALLMAYCFYLLVFYIIFDFSKAFIKLNDRKVSILIFTLATSFTLLGYLNTRFIRETHYQLYSDKLAAPLRLAMIADTHFGTADISQLKLERMVKLINETNSDLVLISGDIVDLANTPAERLGYPQILAKLTSKYGTYAIVGNHETYMGKYKDVIKMLEKHNMHFLDDQQKYLKDINVNVLGITDVGRTGEHKYDIKDFQLNPSHYNILLEHNPKRFSQNITSPVDIQLSGHTHAGQVFLGYIVELFMYENPWGLLSKGEQHLITTSGVGTWGPPVRDTSYPEVVIIDILPRKN